jgi:bisphosphoglycerate-independent phosphoglycerate mutase (AlkP superfamily)
MKVSDRNGKPARPVVLVICDGWGVRDETEGNAIARARTPNFHRMLSEYPSTRLVASGEDVGLPAGQMGNSEVGHLNLGAGRMVPQDILRIDLAIRDGSFFENPALRGACENAKSRPAALHLMGSIPMKTTSSPSWSSPPGSGRRRFSSTLSWTAGTRRRSRPRST